MGHFRGVFGFKTGLLGLLNGALGLNGPVGLVGGAYTLTQIDHFYVGTTQVNPFQARLWVRLGVVVRLSSAPLPIMPQLPLGGRCREVRATTSFGQQNPILAAGASLLLP
jgi:hypothetical protein